MGLPLTADAAAALVQLLERLLAEPGSLTAVRTLEHGLTRHVLDSLAALAIPAVARAGALLDVGSGNGFPGLALALARPDLSVTLLESRARKADWLRRASADVPNVEVVCDRSEHLAGRAREAWPVVVARALAPPPVALELCAPLVAHGGHVALWRGPGGPGDAQAIATAAERLGLQPTPTPTPTAACGHRTILLLRKVAITPHVFPRRPGVARKRPLA